MLPQPRGGGVVQHGGVYVHAESWQRHDVLKAAEGGEAAAFQALDVAAEVAPYLGRVRVAAGVQVVVVLLLLRVLGRAGMLQLDCDAAVFIGSERPDDWRLL